MGSGSGGDVIFLFFEDICGETKDIKMPRHAKSWGEGKSILDQLKDERIKAIKGFKNDVFFAPTFNYFCGRLPFFFSGFVRTLPLKRGAGARGVLGPCMVRDTQRR